jgi:hypothetical protein
MLLSIPEVIKSRDVRCVGHVTFLGTMSYDTIFLTGYFEDLDHVKDFDIGLCKRLVLETILNVLK